VGPALRDYRGKRCSDSSPMRPAPAGATAYGILDMREINKDLAGPVF
jgi:hypothetical protein